MKKKSSSIPRAPKAKLSVGNNPLHKGNIPNPFPVVAIGASLGGLKAFSLLLKYLPATTGMAYIYVQHLDRNHKSLLTSILSRLTKMKVQEVEDMEHMKPDNVYIIPHNKEMVVTDGHIQLQPRRGKSSGSITVDVLFTSLALTHKENVVGVILSGNGSDGTEGMRSIREAGGITMAQDESAQAGSMPQSAVKAGLVDLILSPKAIAEELTRFSKTGFERTVQQDEENSIADNDPDLKVIFRILQKQVNVDFSRYKLNTLKRRIRHRMDQGGIKSIQEYTRLLLNKKNNEVELLYRDLLINVTSFFREPETFRYLKTTFLPRLLRKKTPSETLRIWVPACSTGEEAYSIAMLLTELQEKKPRKIPIQIFATDLSEHAIRDARTGDYTQGEVEVVTKSRLKRFFTKTGDTYRVNKAIREMCVFATHNILRDPPFFKIDFISCCNLLIYFDADAQKKVLATMHFSLSDKGYLMLGKSETTGMASQLFTQANSKFKIYSCKKNARLHKIPELVPGSIVSAPKKKLRIPAKKNPSVQSTALDTAIDAALLSAHMPACAIINTDMEILQFRGATGLYLAHPSGKASLNILKMTRPEFAFELRNAIQHVLKTKQPIRKSGIEMNAGVVENTFRLMSLEVSLLPIEWDEPLLLIVFTLQEKVEKYIENEISGKSKATKKDLRIKKLMSELHTVSLEMHAVIESQEKAYEELQVANEEIVSTNEEFQTLNEELETSKEEIEATNEELISTNQELKLQNDLLAESYEYSQTIIATIHEPMLILDRDLYVKFANKSFYRKFQVTKESTEGKFLFELGNKQWDIPKLRRLLDNLLRKNAGFENLEVTHIFPALGEKTMLLNANRIIQKTHGEKLILLAIEDITERAIREKKTSDDLQMNIRLHLEDKMVLERAVRRRTRQLEIKNIELERANKDLTTFTFVSSHDLQEPLRKIQTFAQLILENEKQNLSAEGKISFHRMQATAKRMQLLIEDLLAYSRSKNPERNFVKTNLNFILDEIKLDLEDALAEKKAKIRAPKLGTLNVLPSQFRQLLGNLIGNSLKFVRPDVLPVISVKTKQANGSVFQKSNRALPAGSLLPKTKYCHIIVADNGIGFDPQYNSRIFEVFQRLHSYEQYKGTGIGLAICKRIVENHNGLITATGKINVGARFDIYIPV